MPATATLSVAVGLIHVTLVLTLPTATVTKISVGQYVNTGGYEDEGGIKLPKLHLRMQNVFILSIETTSSYAKCFHFVCRKTNLEK